MNRWKPYLLALTLTINTTAAAHAKDIDEVLFVVNNGVVLKSDVARLKQNVLLNAETSQLPPEDILQKQLIEQLILEELQLQEAKRFNISADDNKLEAALARVAAERQTTVANMRAQLQRRGVSWEQYRAQIRKEIIISEVRNAMVQRRINILPQEISSLVAQLSEKDKEKMQYHIRHIQLNVDEDAGKMQRDKVLKKAQQLVEQSKAGQNFSSLAMANSNEPRALSGGDWGWMRLEEMPTLFADQVKGKDKGAIIGPFRSGVGFHILKIEDTRGQPMLAVTEINARHILIKPTIILSDSGAQKQLQEIAGKINSKQAAFAQMAKQFSADAGSAAKGGELGWQVSDIYVPEFKAQVDRLAIGKLSQPFKTVHGWHLVEVLGRREADRTQAAMENRAYQLLLNRKFSEEVNAWLQELRAGAYVEDMRAQ
ncbi:MAG: peptidylprolyl isomerase SurA [Enterovibrio sp.]